MATEYPYGFGFQAAPWPARKLLLAVKEGPLPPAAPAPTALCRDVRTGELVRCSNPDTVVMVLVGMACMIFLVGVALGLLCWSVVKQRRHRRAMETHLITTSIESVTPHPHHLASATSASTVPVDSVEFDDAVLVQLPGEAKPQFFALPKPFLADNGSTESVDPELTDGDDVEHGKADCGSKEGPVGPEIPDDSDPPDAPSRPPDDRPAL